MNESLLHLLNWENNCFFFLIKSNQKKTSKSMMIVGEDDNEYDDDKHSIKSLFLDAENKKKVRINKSSEQGKWSDLLLYEEIWK